jgi:serum/glucocorticoid-regulated kinase 2
MGNETSTPEEPKGDGDSYHDRLTTEGDEKPTSLQQNSVRIQDADTPDRGPVKQGSGRKLQNFIKNHLPPPSPDSHHTPAVSARQLMSAAQMKLQKGKEGVQRQKEKVQRKFQKERERKQQMMQKRGGYDEGREQNWNTGLVQRNHEGERNAVGHSVMDAQEEMLREHAREPNPVNFMYASSEERIDPSTFSNSHSNMNQITGMMTNMTVDSSLNHNNIRTSVSQPIMTSSRSDEDMWDRAWTEDTESDDDDDDEHAVNDNDQQDSDLDASGIAVLGTASHSIQPVSQTPWHQTARPVMDGAHSSSMPMSGNNMPYKENSGFRNMTGQPTSAVGPNHKVMVNVPGEERDTFDEEKRILSEKCTSELQLGKDGNEWDKDSDSNPGQVMYEKPNIMMFLPLLRVLGKGSFGKVVLVQKRCGKEKDGLFAMKILKKSHLLKRNQIARTRTERKVLSIVDHPFIMKLHFAFQTDDRLFLVLDYCAGGELFFHLSRHRRFPETWTRFYAAELLLALAHLHSKGIIYRDLKPENVLLDAEGHVKLGDFGLAKAGITHPYKGATSMCGTPEYMAPEILQGLGHGFCADYWGLGMLTYEMMTGLPPWYTTDRNLLYQRLRSAPLQIPSSFSPQVSSCIIALLQRDPRRRLGVRGPRSAMAHDFFRGIDFRSVIYRKVQPPIRPCEGWKSSHRENTTKKRVSEEPNVSSDYSGESSQSPDLDAATANFDSQFTRLAVDSVELESEDAYSDDEDVEEELNERTFIGFTFDEDDQRIKN